MEIHWTRGGNIWISVIACVTCWEQKTCTQVLYNENTQNMDIKFSLSHMHTTCRTSCANVLLHILWTYKSHVAMIWFLWLFPELYMVNKPSCVCCLSYTYPNHTCFMDSVQLFHEESYPNHTCFVDSVQLLHDVLAGIIPRTDGTHVQLIWLLLMFSQFHIRVILQPCTDLVIFVIFGTVHSQNE